MANLAKLNDFTISTVKISSGPQAVSWTLTDRAQLLRGTVAMVLRHGYSTTEKVSTNSQGRENRLRGGGGGPIFTVKKRRIGIKTLKQPRTLK